MSMKTRAVAAAVALASAWPAVAQERDVRGILGAGFTFGGDTLATVDFTDGSRETIDSGSLVHLYAGAQVRVSPQMTVQTTFGYHVDDTSSAGNGSLRFSRYPIELLAHWQLAPQWRIGGGARVVSGAKLSGSGVLGDIGVKFDSTVGGVLEGEYLVTPNVGIKLRGVSESYKPAGGGASIDGSHFGVYVSWYL